MVKYHVKIRFRAKGAGQKSLSKTSNTVFYHVPSTSYYYYYFRMSYLYICMCYVFRCLCVQMCTCLVCIKIYNMIYYCIICIYFWIVVFKIWRWRQVADSLQVETREKTMKNMFLFFDSCGITHCSKLLNCPLPRTNYWIIRVVLKFLPICNGRLVVTDLNY